MPTPNHLQNNNNNNNNRYKTFVNFTEVDDAVLAVEHARHASWRVAGQLRYLIERPLWESTPFEGGNNSNGNSDANKGALRAVLRNAAAELIRAERLIGGEDVGEVHMSQHRDEEGERSRGGKSEDLAVSAELVDPASSSKRPRLKDGK